jgi:hypothetical protein
LWGRIKALRARGCRPIPCQLNLPGAASESGSLRFGRPAPDHDLCHNQRLSRCSAAAMAEPLASSSACSVGVNTRASQLSGSSARGQGGAEAACRADPLGLGKAAARAAGSGALISIPACCCRCFTATAATPQRRTGWWLLKKPSSGSARGGCWNSLRPRPYAIASGDLSGGREGLVHCRGPAPISADQALVRQYSDA